MKRNIKLTIATSAVLAALAGSAIYAQSAHEKYSLKSPTRSLFAQRFWYGWKIWSLADALRNADSRMFPLVRVMWSLL